jgi:hypothetical protein
MARLPNITCPDCKQPITSRNGLNTAAIKYSDCLRQCEPCGNGFSNANTDKIEHLTIILRDPFLHIPASIANGWEAVFAQALNETNRESKHAKIASLNSEDHVTWTVFRYLQERKYLRPCLSALNLDWLSSATEEPTLLLWGVPVPLCDANGKSLRDALICVLDTIGEDRKLYSEPDVILDFGRTGLIFIEVKLKSPNDSGEANERWQKYFKGPTHSSLSQPFADVEGIRHSGLYELMRNWRIAWDLTRERPMALVNLGPERLFQGQAEAAKLDQFQGALSLSSTRRFVPATWETILHSIPHQDEWFARYTKRRIGSA